MARNEDICNFDLGWMQLMPVNMTIDEWLEVVEDPFSSLPPSPHLAQSQTAESPVIQPHRLSQTSATMSPGPVAVPIWNASLSGASGNLRLPVNSTLY